MAHEMNPEMTHGLPPESSRPRVEPRYVDWSRSRQQRSHRHEPVIALRHAQADASEAADVHGQDLSWAQRHAQERRLHDSAIAQLRSQV